MEEEPLQYHSLSSAVKRYEARTNRNGVLVAECCGRALRKGRLEGAVTKDHQVDLRHDWVEGEMLEVLERLVVASHRGRFCPLDKPVVATIIGKGDAVGWIEQLGNVQPVLSPFGGRVIGMLVHPGELVREGEGVAWLRLADEGR